MTPYTSSESDCSLFLIRFSDALVEIKFIGLLFLVYFLPNSHLCSVCRVAKQNGGANAANQVAFLWARTLHIDSAIKLLNKYGILEQSINYACETYQFDFAFQLCKNLQSKVDIYSVNRLLRLIVYFEGE